MRRYEWSDEELAARGLDASDLPARLGRVVPTRGGVALEVDEANERALLAWMPVSPRVVESREAPEAATTKWVEVPIEVADQVEAIVRDAKLAAVVEAVDVLEGGR